MNRVAVSMVAIMATLPPTQAASPGNCPNVQFSSSGADTLTCDYLNKCPNCNMNCNANQKCTTKCTADRACERATLNCPDGKDCVVKCEWDNACTDMTVNCPTTGKCLITCANQWACKGMKIRQRGGGGQLDLKCNGHNSCTNANVVCPTSGAKCTIGCPEQNSCSTMTVTAAGTSPLDMDCKSTRACFKSTITCPASADCNVQCESPENSCLQMKVKPEKKQPSNTPQTGTVTVTCKNNNDCRFAKLDCGYAASCKMTCTGNYACEEVEMKCTNSGTCIQRCSYHKSCSRVKVLHSYGAATGGETRLLCETESACETSQLTCKANRECNRKCRGHRGCFDSTFDCSQSGVERCSQDCRGGEWVCQTTMKCPSEPYKCESTCVGDNACKGSLTGHAYPTYCQQTGSKPPCDNGYQNAADKTTEAPTPSPGTDAPPTAVPTTPQPATSSPVTSSVPTPAPAISVPATDAPATNPPMTFQPAVGGTATPKTFAPVTGAADTSAPDTDAAVTPAPPSGKALTGSAKDKVNGATSVSSGTALLSGAGAGAIARVAVLKDLGCEVEDVDIDEDETLDWEFHPTGLGVGNSPRKYLFGAVVMNPVLILGILTLLAGLAACLKFCKGLPTWGAALGAVKAPGLIFIPFLFLVQGTSLISARVAFFPGNGLGTFEVGLAWVVLIICITSPGVLYAGVLRRVHTEACMIPDARLHPDDPLVKRLCATSGAPKVNAYTGVTAVLYKLAFGDRIWVSSDAGSFFADMYGGAFDSFKPGAVVWFPCLEIMVMVILSMLAAWRPTKGMACDTRNIFICCLFAGFFFTIVIKRPYLSVFDNFVAVLLSFCMFLSVLLMTTGLWMQLHSESFPFLSSAYILLSTAYIVLFKAVWDMVVYFIDIYIGRRQSARTLARESANSSNHSIPEMSMEIMIYVTLPNRVPDQIEILDPISDTVSLHTSSSYTSIGFNEKNGQFRI